VYKIIRRDFLLFKVEKEKGFLLLYWCSRKRTKSRKKEKNKPRQCDGNMEGIYMFYHACLLLDLLVFMSHLHPFGSALKVSKWVRKKRGGVTHPMLFSGTHG
jgi:hypothetical protein